MLFLAGFLFAFVSGNLSRAQVKAAGTPAGVRVNIKADKTSFNATKPVTLHVTFTNPTSTSIGLLKWFTPIDGVTEPLFTVTRAGNSVTYVGILVKHPPPTTQDYVTLAPGKSLSRDVNLSDYYDLSVSGNYSVTFAAGGLTSNTLNLFVEGRPARAPQAIPAQAVSGMNTFNGCSDSQQTNLIDARNAAGTYASVAKAYFMANRHGLRYTTWFGGFDSGRHTAVSSHFSAISDAVDNKLMSFDCTGEGSCRGGYYAYVYPGSPYNIYLCSAFWASWTPLTGTDSKAGTLIHEISHFYVVAGTKDWAYGQTGAKALAISNPSQAIMNADSHEYFAENNPPLETTPTTPPQAWFTDVDTNYWAFSEIKKLYLDGFTTGCSVTPFLYCPERAVTRAQMAVFIERGIHGAAYLPPAATGVFADVHTDYWAAAWIEQLYKDKITSGCGTSPLRYCPESSTTRAEMAVFLLKAEHGASYIPTAAIGLFPDVLKTYWAADWIEKLFMEHITGGCSASPMAFCPDNSVTRAQMAVFLVKTFKLP